MTGNTNPDLVQPFNEPKQKLHSTRKLFDLETLVLPNLPKFNLFADQENHVFLNQDIVAFELKGQFLKELRENTFNGADSKDANEHIIKGFDVATSHMLHSHGPIAKTSAKNAKTSIQEMAYHSLMWQDKALNRHKGNGNFDGLVVITIQLHNLGREIKKMTKKVYAIHVGCQLCHGPHFSKDFLMKKERKAVKEVYYGEFYERPYPKELVKNQGLGLEEWDAPPQALDPSLHHYTWRKKTHSRINLV
nr:hypothetical protein [Tanacetum cinerariifolium]